MEMQQVRYFVALAETLNFTRAAERCNVSQPALTRAIQQLEYELGGSLVRREGRNTHLTELGDRMLPLLRQCHESVICAKELASAVKKGERSRFSLGVAGTIDLALLLALLVELQRHFPGMRLQLRRGSAAQIEAMLKSGEIELAISEPFPEHWERLDTYPMFTECFDYIVGRDQTAATNEPVSSSIEEMPVLVHRGAVFSDEHEARLAEAGIDLMKAHHVESCRDLEALVLARVGIGIAPSSALQSKDLDHIHCEGLNIRRNIAIYSVAGRRRTREGAAFLSLARTADWSQLEAA